MTSSLDRESFLSFFEEDVKTIAETVETIFARKYSTRKKIRAQNKESTTLFLLSFSTLDQLARVARIQNLCGEGQALWGGEME